MQLHLDGKNICILNKKPEYFKEVFLIRDRFIFKSADGSILSVGAVAGNHILACLHCEQLRNITILSDDGEYKKITFILDNKDNFEQLLDLFEAVCDEEMISAQNKKINGYSTALVEKLKDGIKLTIVETREQGDITLCPACGMQCEPGIPYCMECGANIE